LTFLFFYIKEWQPKLIMSKLAFPKDDFGRSIISAYNKVIQKSGGRKQPKRNPLSRNGKDYDSYKGGDSEKRRIQLKQHKQDLQSWENLRLAKLNIKTRVLGIIEPKNPDLNL